MSKHEVRSIVIPAQAGIQTVLPERIRRRQNELDSGSRCAWPE